MLPASKKGKSVAHIKEGKKVLHTSKKGKKVLPTSKKGEKVLPIPKGGGNVDSPHPAIPLQSVLTLAAPSARRCSENIGLNV